MPYPPLLSLQRRFSFFGVDLHVYRKSIVVFLFNLELLDFRMHVSVLMLASEARQVVLTRCFRSPQIQSNLILSSLACFGLSVNHPQIAVFASHVNNLVVVVIGRVKNI